jgi:type IV secretion system protein VirB11
MPIQVLLDDKNISEIMINRPHQVYYEKKGRMTEKEVPEYSVKTLSMLFQLIATESKQLLNREHPLLSGSLFDGSRVQLVLPPVAKFPVLSVRRKVSQNHDWEDYADIGYFDQTQLHNENSSEKTSEDSCLLQLYKEKKWHQFLAEAVKLKKNIVVSGGTSTGKTTLMNALLNNIDASDRIILLEDTREIDLRQDNIIQLLSSKGDQGIAKISLQDLLQCSLRLRPDRIICGEIRGKEILDFISACSTGHEGSMTSIHANNPRIAFMRMVQMYKLNNVPFMTDESIMKELNEVIDIIVQLVRDEKGRRVETIYYKGALDIRGR